MTEGARGVLGLRAWRVGVVALPMQVCYFAIFYLALKTGAGFSVLQLLALVFALWLYLAYIVLVNDLADREVDAAVGKGTVERGHGLGPRTIAGLLVLIVVAGATTVVWLGRGQAFDAVWLLAYVLGTAYSVPPFSLKRRGALGFAADSLIEKPLPVLAVFAFFGYYGPEVVLFPVLGELLDSVFKHQAHDYEIDVKTGMRTFAVALGKERSEKIVGSVIHPVDVALVLAAFAVVVAEVPAARLAAATALALLLLVFAAVGLRYGSALVHPLGSDWADPPYVTYFVAGFQALLITVLGATVALKALAYLPLFALFLVSLAPHLLSYGIRARAKMGLRGHAAGGENRGARRP